MAKADLTSSALKAIDKIVGDRIHEEFTEYHASMVKPELDGLKKEMGGVRKEMKSGFDKARLERKSIKDEVRGLKAELSITATKKEVRELIAAS